MKLIRCCKYCYLFMNLIKPKIFFTNKNDK